MQINLAEFSLINILDSCSVWNILSSTKIYITSLSAGCHFSFTKYVEYECLVKPRKHPTANDAALRELLIKEIAKKKFQTHEISINDLQSVGLPEDRKRLGKGELSSIAFAKKTNQPFLTDDKAARTFAKKVLGTGQVQTTPHLVGHLFYKRHLLDGDLNVIVAEHNAYIASNWGRLDNFFKSVYEESLRIRLMETMK